MALRPAGAGALPLCGRLRAAARGGPRARQGARAAGAGKDGRPAPARDGSRTDGRASRRRAHRPAGRIPAGEDVPRAGGGDREPADRLAL
ncbi:hypothetical protein D4A47_08750 [Anaerotruncus massiliensis (ex Liu et al. 2021)]|uniref:Uncharacterized protein n=1 Tax=Anaerotruncus massiliensis (ex Liu et al. 2021) TaxID=2321404 RepID=A0A498CXZ9_9FIRM|nr:hypothetical protein D4A47_08750 [Anaerotruncus massiliensis (ex Liu et al. 2021)]